MMCRTYKTIAELRQMVEIDDWVDGLENKMNSSEHFISLTRANTVLKKSSQAHSQGQVLIYLLSY